MSTIKFNIDGKDVEVRNGRSVLEAALDSGIYIPHLCYHEDLSPIGACRLCIVEIEGMEGLVLSCSTPAAEGMVVKTGSESIDASRRLAMELLLAGHPPDCGTCVKYLNCELQSLKQYIIGDHIRVRTRSKLIPVNADNPIFLHEPNKCVLCGRCVRACHELRGVGVLFYKKQGRETYIGTENGLSLAESGCRFCGACAEVCPTGAIMDKEEFAKGKSRKAALVPCRYACPAEIDVPKYIRFIREKNYSAAAAVIREKVPFPGVLGYVCDHPCEDVCKRGEINHPISIRNLKRYAVEHDTEKIWKEKSRKKDATGRKAAVIGSGPAGLTAAYYLCKQGHEVTVFEALPQAGGMMRYGIPEYRMPRDILDGEIKIIEDTGVEIKTDSKVESIDNLFDDGYEAVLVAVGAHKGQKLRIPGARSEGVLTGLDFLRDVNLGNEVNIGKRVVVLGGGNVAFDCARVAKRAGAEEVHIACLECREDMPASCDEIDQGEQEGICLNPSKSFKRIINEEKIAKGVEFLDVESLTFDEDNLPQVEVVDDSEHILEADTIIFAIGQQPDIPEEFDLDKTDRNLIELDSYTFETSREGVYAAGDAVSGTASVIEAIASGRKAASIIDKFLDGDGRIDEKLAPEAELQKCLGPDPDFAAMDRVEEVCVLPEERLMSFCRVVDEMDEASADYESKRCLQCDLRLSITPVKFWGNY
ncbi:MAG: FAD-dependent oxidoreductase [Spirochaetes bacterium]|nr:FAD-dependent oxidoreductase [Spirochaetota bacterium]